MTNLIPHFKNELAQIQPRFEQLLTDSQVKMNFEKEVYFALQILSQNNFLCKIAQNNPNSLQSAVLNIATIGLSLNPAEKCAYLVPRDGRVCLDISYLGLCKLATNIGSVSWVQSKLVHEQDEFIYNGASKEPTHKFNAFKDRGPVVGVYCLAKVSSGEFLTEIMSLEECFAIRDRSMAWKKGKSGPWKTDTGEMIKKTVIKRASKLWPKGQTVFLDRAIDVINEHEGIDFEEEKKLEFEKQKKLQQEQKGKNYKLASEIINNIKAILSDLTNGLEPVDKLNFLKTYVGVDSFKVFQKMSVDELIECETRLLEISEASNADE